MNIGELTATLGIDDRGIVEAEKSFTNYGKHVITTLDSVNGKLKQQTGLIGDIKNAIEELKKKREGTWKIEEIEKYNKKISEAEQNLKEFEQAGIPAVATTNSMADSLKRMAIQLIAGVAVWKTFKAIIESTGTTSLWFHSIIEGARTGLDYFMKSIATADFSNFIDGLRTAIKAGKEYRYEMNRIGDIGREYAIKELDLQKLIEEQRRIMYESDKTATVDKIKAGEEIIRLMQQRADMEVELATKTYMAVAKKTGDTNKLTEEQIKYAIQHYTEIEKVGETYNRLKRIADIYYNKVKNHITIQEDEIQTLTDFWKVGEGNIKTIGDLEQAMKDLGEAAPTAGVLIQALGDMTDKEKDAITRAVVAVKQAENQFLIDSRFIYRMIENMRDASLKEQLKDWEDYYKEAARQHRRFLDEYTTDIRNATKDLNIPEFKEPSTYRKQLMIFDPTYMEEVQTALASIAQKNAAFGDSFDAIAQQAQFLTIRLESLWAQGIRPGNEDMDTMIEQLKEFRAELTKLELKKEVFNILSNSIADMATQLGMALAGGEEAWMNMVDTILRGGQQIINMLLVEAIAGLIAKETTSKGIFGLATAAIGIGVLMGLWEGYKSKASSAAKMAEGGIVPAGYPNDTFPAMLSSGEMVTPLDKFGVIMQKAFSREIRLQMKLQGMDILISNERAGKFKKLVT